MLLFLVFGLRSVERSVSAIFVASVPLINLDFLEFPSFAICTVAIPLYCHFLLKPVRVKFLY